MNLEKKIFNDNLSVDEIPVTWNEMFKEWFGIEVPEDRLGVYKTSTVHGCARYFPTYFGNHDPTS